MADQEKRKLDIPWGTILPIVVAFAGIIAQYRPLVSVRPAVPSEKSVGIVADQDVDARLWQDPLGVAQKERAALDADLQVKKVPQDRVYRHTTKALAERIKKSVIETEKQGVLVLAVMLDSGPYLEQAESRLRARQAVLEGLSESGYVPVDGEHIGFAVHEPWPLVREDSAGPEVTPTSGATASASPAPSPVAGGGGSLMFAWEECRAVVNENERATAAQASLPQFENWNVESVFVLWLPGSNFNSNPLGNFAELLRALSNGRPEDRSDFRAKLIGPSNSTGLRAMLREAKEWVPGENPERAKALEGVSIICARATAAEKDLREEAGLNPVPYPDAPEQPEESIEELIGKVAPGLQFQRTILPDDVLLGALIDELALRQIHVAPWQDGTQWKDGDPVAILSEWDNTYGRSLAKTFEDEAGAATSPGAPKDVHPQIDFFRYMHGIDGRLPGDAPKETKNDSQKATAGNVPSEATEGLNQADYLRRLARWLKEKERHRRNAGGGTLRAIGLLGNDIYDKLMILRALRPEFPDAIFFTNNYDAHFELHDEWDDTHNLIVASPFTSTFLLDGKTRIAPFRDSNQTATYAGTLFAMGAVKKPDETVGEPYIFEVGRNGVQELSSPTNEFTGWLHGPGRKMALFETALGLFLLAGWIILSMADRRLSGGGDPWQKLKRTGSNTLVWLLLGVPIIVWGVTAFATTGAASLEPLKFFSGVSIWPSEMVRLLALLLAIHFLIKARVDMDLNQKKVAMLFHLEELPAEKWHWRNPRLGLRRWHKEHPEWMQDEAPLSAKDAWMAYLQRNQFQPRVIRVAALVAIYGLFALGVFSLFPYPIAPARGDVALTADKVILAVTVFGTMVLTFYVVDAIRLTSNLIRIVTGGVTQWDAEAAVAGGRIPPLTKADLTRYYDIAFVAERTDVVARLIWYPLIVLALMILARSAYFDNWTWPYSLVLILCLNAFWAFGAAALLRRAAEQLRTEAITKLQSLRVASYKDRDRRDMFEDMITEIRALKKGAFAPLSEQPFVRAIILPSGGLGLLAVGQRLLEIF